MEILVTIISGFLILLGAVGSFLPILPGTPISYAGLFLYAWYTDFDRIGPVALTVFGILTALTLVVDFVAPSMGAKGYKASRYGSIGAALGAFLGIFVMGPLGLIFGPMIGAFVGEFMYTRNMDASSKVAIGSLVGFAIGSMAKAAVVAAMMAYFVFALF